MSEYTNRLINLLYNCGDWSRESTIEAYKLLDKIFCTGEIKVEDCSSTDLKAVLKQMSDLLCMEAAEMKNFAAKDARETILEIAMKLHLFNNEQWEYIISKFYE